MTTSGKTSDTASAAAIHQTLLWLQLLLLASFRKGIKSLPELTDPRTPRNHLPTHTRSFSCCPCMQRIEMSSPPKKGR